MVTVAAVSLLPFLEDDGKRGVLLAAGIAFPVQVTAFGLLLRAQESPLVSFSGGVSELRSGS